ncbi:MAG: HAMP domain-containing histidine kinase [Zoogloeaceae bacterium]|jgi:two-component system sensor histidine kinase GlrK|nr:HAMP domain-containing histidine kinase [Zoogloeaceae bacterium]
MNFFDRFSFRQILVTGFGVVILLLVSAILQSWSLLEHLTEQSLQGGAQIVRFSASLQTLDERNVDLERSVRQYLLVRQDNYRRALEANYQQALALTEQLEKQPEVPEIHSLLKEWRAISLSLLGSLDSSDADNSVSIGNMLSSMSDLQNRMRQIGQQWAENKNLRVTQDLANYQMQLRLQLALSTLSALFVALLISWYLIRSVQQTKTAIALLSDGRFHEAIQIDGSSDMRQIGAHLDLLRQRLVEKNKSQEAVLCYAEQEIRLPLAAVQNGISLLSEEVSGKLTEDQRAIVNILDTNFTFLQRHAEILADLTQKICNMTEIQCQPIKLGELMRLAVESRSDAVRESGVDIHVDLRSEEQEEVRTDVGKVLLMLGALLDNALDVSSAAADVILAAELQADSLVLECHDQGEGIAQDEAARAFELSYRKASPKQTEVKIGHRLFVAKELALRMWGSIQLLPSDGTGTHVRIVIPRQ